MSFFTRNKSEDDFESPTIGQIVEQQKQAATMGEGPGSASRPTRPGDTPARQFVGSTLESLNKILANYSTERDLLRKDIAKLQEEERQVVQTLEAVSAAISMLEKPARQSPADRIAAAAMAAPYGKPSATPDVYENAAAALLEGELARKD